ncbi:aldo/keto reductase [Clostridium carboxidivorans P7]|uniref:Aldo/keto reductase n=1 Tax=Clostridium carboxidivorans P7 TaxID=536227 RepID=C6PXG3_9CLOT|nr:aldo/keto reductase [Clostridium carboxidivorans]AKN31668.1 aldo/keto reductase [Clostridium carboxidivorans P7]EET86089.1 aldo/keto reductase [Clostridium carboxidivorans P7]EFG87511.1 4Fe-4S binding domain protein [Clostridium carboxidivorans P7]
MEYRILGRTGIKVSAIGIGGEGFENKGYEDCEEIIDTAMKQGINFIDIYNSNPEVRSNVGKALSKYPRNSFVIEGHLCSTWDKGQYRRTRDIDEVVSAYEDFLTRMKLDYVDVGMIHYVDDEKDFNNIFNGEIIKYAKGLKEKGVIKSLGISTHNPDIAFKAVETGIIDVILFSINAAYDMLPANEDVNILFEESTFKNRTYEGIDPKRDKLYQTCENEGVALTVMKGYGAGVLLSDKESPFEKALTSVQCLHYCLTRPSVASVMVGVSDTNQILAATAYVTAEDKEKDYSEVLANAPRSSFRGHCMYCGHCAPCSKNIDIASVNKYLDLALIQETVPETLKNHYDLLKHQANECIECGICMKNCPFGVDIIKKMKQAVELFGN